MRWALPILQCTALVALVQADLLANRTVASFAANSGMVKICHKGETKTVKQKNLQVWLQRGAFRGECPKITGDRFVVRTATDDAVLLEAKLRNDLSTNVVFYGDKNLFGNIEHVTAFTVEGKGQLYAFWLNADNTLSTATSVADVINMDLTWSSGRSKVNFLTQYYNKLYTSHIDIARTFGQRDLRNALRREPDRVPLPDDPKDEVEEPTNHHHFRGEAARRLTGNESRHIQTQIWTNSRTFTDARAMLTYYVENETGGRKKRGVILGQNRDNGVVDFAVPVAVDRLANVMPACKRATRAINNACGTFIGTLQIDTSSKREKFCDTMGSTLELVEVVKSDIDEIIAGCKRMLEAAYKGCSILTPDKTTSQPNLDKLICDASLAPILNFQAERWDLEAKIMYPFTLSNAEPIRTSGQVPKDPTDRSFDLGDYFVRSTPWVQRLSVNPSDPDPKQGYNFTAQIQGLADPDKDLVTLSVRGSDGFVVSDPCRTRSVDRSKNVVTCSFAIPGAAATTFDKCAARIGKTGDERTLDVVF